LGLRIVTRKGEHFYNRSASWVLEICGLQHLIVASKHEFIEESVALIDDRGYRESVANQVAGTDLDESLFRDDNSDFFRQAMRHLVDNAEGLRASGDRQPLVFA
jgi:predicted O-linked N-acetylglucosamine transferase (SPINDLY family)